MERRSRGGVVLPAGSVDVRPNVPLPSSGRSRVQVVVVDPAEKRLRSGMGIRGPGRGKLRIRP